jgi:arginyl-tRNA synthetase
LFSSVANLVASGCRASLQLVDHLPSFQNQAYYLCRHIIFSCMMYNEICQYSTSITNDSSALALYGTVPINRSFPYSVMNRSTNELVKFEELNNEKLLDQCRKQCLNESNKALELLQTNFDQKSSATNLLRSIIQQIQDGIHSKKVI